MSVARIFAGFIYRRFLVGRVVYGLLVPGDWHSGRPYVASGRLRYKYILVRYRTKTEIIDVVDRVRGRKLSRVNSNFGRAINASVFYRADRLVA